MLYNEKANRLLRSSNQAGNYARKLIGSVLVSAVGTQFTEQLRVLESAPRSRAC